MPSNPQLAGLSHRYKTCSYPIGHPLGRKLNVESQELSIPLVTEIQLTTLRDLTDGKVIAANKERITISKDGKIFVIEFGSGAVKELIKM